MLKQRGYLYKNTVGDHHPFEHSTSHTKITIAGNLGKELTKGAWHRLQKELGLK